MGSVYALSIHADYRCRHSGVCCASDWDVPVEVPLYRRLETELAAGRLHPAAAVPPGAAFITGPDLPRHAGAIVARTASGHCVFYHAASRRCVIHRDAGEAHLPSSCRHFPRLAVRDRRGTFISLTHYCPSAAAMLFREDVSIEIVESPRAFPFADYDGLRVDADAWPPLLHPCMLMDLEGYSAWERHMVCRCNLSMLSPESVIATLARNARILRGYQPASGPLTDAVAKLPVDAVCAPESAGLDASLALHSEVMSAVPGDIRPESDDAGLREAFLRAVTPRWAEYHGPLRKYLAAKAFANWNAYQGRGVLTIVRGLEAALAFVRVEAARECRNADRALDADLLKQAFRAADFVLNHLAAGEELAERWSRVEDWDATMQHSEYQIPSSEQVSV
jgi:hypothetical protein